MSLRLTTKRLIKPTVSKITVPGKPGIIRPSASRMSNAAGDAATLEGFRRADVIAKERDKQAEVRKERPFEFFMKRGESYQGKKGVPVVITDVKPFFQYMHHWGFETGNSKHEVCIKDDPSGCPLCAKLQREGGWELFLSVIDFRQYTPKKGPNAGKTIPRSKRSLGVKVSMIPKYERLYDKHKTFRGMCLRIFRDGEKSASSGSDLEFVRFMPEDELKRYGELAVPINWQKAYPRPTYDELAERYGINGSGMASAAGEEDFSGDIADDSVPF